MLKVTASGRQSVEHHTDKVAWEMGIRREQEGREGMKVRIGHARRITLYK